MGKNILSIEDIYNNLYKPILKKDSGIDPEYLTNFSLSLLGFCSDKQNWPLIKNVIDSLKKEFCIEDKKLNKNISGIKFANPLGLAAGFDKN